MYRLAVELEDILEDIPIAYYNVSNVWKNYPMHNDINHDEFPVYRLDYSYGDLVLLAII